MFTKYGLVRITICGKADVQYTCSHINTFVETDLCIQNIIRDKLPYMEVRNWKMAKMYNLRFMSCLLHTQVPCCQIVQIQ